MAAKPFNTFVEAANSGPFDERPMLLTDVDPQLHLSRNDRPQPFYLVCQKDSVIVQVSGEGRVDFSEGSVRFFPVEPGDFVYVPAGMPHRIIPDGDSIQYRFKAREPGLEGTAWFCAKCQSEVARRTWDTAVKLPQEGYQETCEWFNDDEANRTCATCGEIHPPADTSGVRWKEIVAELRS